MDEFHFLLRRLNLICERPQMYGEYAEHIESIVKHIVHIYYTIIDSSWTYDLTILEFQKAKILAKVSDTVNSIESETVRKLKWGPSEDQTRQAIIKVYFDIWQQLKNLPRLSYTSKWIEFLLSGPPILRSPNEVDLVLNVLFRTALQENYTIFANLYAEKVIMLRGSASIGLYDWNIQNEELFIDPFIEKKETIEDLRTVILKIITSLKKEGDFR